MRVGALVALAGLVALVVALLTGSTLLAILVVALAALGIVLLLLPFLPFIGGEKNGAYIWIYVAGFSFQPGEVAKIALAIFLLTRRNLLAGVAAGAGVLVLLTFGRLG